VSFEDELIELEREGWRALSSGAGGAYYRKRLTDNALMAFSFGVLTREARSRRSSPFSRGRASR
jgi:hypothetical protein